MFEDSFLANLVIFALGQAAAWGYLRTGLVRRGVALVIGGWVLADVALLARFAYDGLYAVFWCALVAMQAYSLVELALFAWRRVRRRSPRAHARRAELCRAAFVHYLRDELGPAASIYRRLLRHDPWDLESKLSLASVLARSGAPHQARVAFRGAAALDRAGSYRDFIEVELARLGTAQPPAGVPQGSLGAARSSPA